MEATLIVTVALASAMIVVVPADVYNSLRKTIDENAKLRQKIDRSGIMNQ